MKRPYAVLARRHWAKRWSQPALDHWMGGRGIGPENARAAEIVRSLGASSVLEIGPGCFRFARVLSEAGVRVTAVELPYPRAAAFRPAPVACWYSSKAWPLPWREASFDVAYQHDALTNMPTRDMLRCLDELARVAKRLVWAGVLRPRFFEHGKKSGGERAAWAREEIMRRFDLEWSEGKIMVLRPKESRGAS